MTKKEEFIKFIDKCIDGMEGSCLLVHAEVPELLEHERILNANCNLQAKRKYYNESYDDDLRLKVNKKVKIVKWETLENFIHGQEECFKISTGGLTYKQRKYLISNIKQNAGILSPKSAVNINMIIMNAISNHEEKIRRQEGVV